MNQQQKIKHIINQAKFELNLCQNVILAKFHIFKFSWWQMMNRYNMPVLAYMLIFSKYLHSHIVPGTTFMGGTHKNLLFIYQKVSSETNLGVSLHWRIHFDLAKVIQLCKVFKKKKRYGRKSSLCVSVCLSCNLDSFFFSSFSILSVYVFSYTLLPSCTERLQLPRQEVNSNKCNKEGLNIIFPTPYRVWILWHI